MAQVQLNNDVDLTDLDLSALQTGQVTQSSSTGFTVAAADSTFTFSGTGFSSGGDGGLPTSGHIHSLTATLADGTLKVSHFAMSAAQFAQYVATDNVQGFETQLLAAKDLFNLRDAGDVNVNGYAGNDKFFLGSSLQTGDVIHGGDGYDAVYVNGAYANPINISAQTIQGIEKLAFNGAHSYAVTLHDDATDAGQHLLVAANTLANSQSFSLDASSVSNESLTVEGSSGADIIKTGALSDIVHGGDGADQISTGAGNDFIGSGTGDDAVNGGAGNDIVHAGAGNDVLSGNDGHDQLWGGIGNDTIDGGAASDKIYGGKGVDNISGGSGNDNLHAGSGSDTISGGDGNDKIWGNAGNDTIDSGAGTDTAHGGTGNDIFNGGSGQDHLYGDAGNDQFNLLEWVSGDKIDGGAGDDTLNLGSNQGLTDLGLNTATLNGVEHLNLMGDHSFDVMADGDLGLTQNLDINGSGLSTGSTLTVDGTKMTGVGIDATGSSGNDIITGTAANDILQGGLGSDILNGDGGHDTFVYKDVADSTGSAIDTIQNFDAGKDTIEVSHAVDAVSTSLVGGVLNDLSGLTSLLGINLGAHDAMIVKPLLGNLAGDTFMVVDQNGQVGFQAGQDLIVQLQGPVDLSHLGVHNFTI